MNMAIILLIWMFLGSFCVDCLNEYINKVNKDNLSDFWFVFNKKELFSFIVLHSDVFFLLLELL